MKKSIGGFNLVTLSQEDAEGALALSAEVGWNQTFEDWGLLIGQSTALGLKDEHSTLQATVVALHYGDEYAWIAMLIVAPKLRGKGTGSFLLDSALEASDTSGRISALDATPEGEPLYRARGFRPLFRLVRVELRGRGHFASSDQGERRGGDPRPRPNRIVAINPSEDLAATGLFFEQDRTATGLERTSVMESLLLRRHTRLLVIEGIRGSYLLIRRGRIADQIGPLYANDEPHAVELLRHALESARGDRCFVDVPEYQEGVLAWLESQGGRVQRSLTRMIRHPRATFPIGERTLYAVAGPELG